MMLDVTNPNNFTHWFTHRLAIALRFFDVFTGKTVEAPLRVTVPAHGWEAIHRTSDATYRFLVTEAIVPSGTFHVFVEDTDQTYTNHEPIEIALTTVPSTPPISRGNYLQEYPLWPTRKFKAPVGETAVVGRLVSAGANPVENLDVRLYPTGEAPPADHFARSNSAGEFLFRLPWIQREVDGTPLPLSIEVQITRAGVPLSPVTPSSFTPEPGHVRYRTFNIP